MEGVPHKLRSLKAHKFLLATQGAQYGTSSQQKAETLLDHSKYAYIRRRLGFHITGGDGFDRPQEVVLAIHDQRNKNRRP